MLRVHDIKKAYGGHQALDGVTFEIGDRDKVALVGINGAGKSTLLKIIAGIIPLDEGLIRVTENTEISYLPQDAGIRSGLTLWDEMMASFPELIEIQAELAQIEASMATDYEDLDRLDQLVNRQGELLERFEQLDGYRVEAEIAKVLAGLGFAPNDRDKPCEAFSGGWQMRIALARMLVRKPGGIRGRIACSRARESWLKAASRASVGDSCVACCRLTAWLRNRNLLTRKNCSSRHLLRPARIIACPSCIGGAGWPSKRAKSRSLSSGPAN